MSTLCKIPVVWDGLPGMPGLSMFYSNPTDVVTTVVALKAFFTSLSTGCPTGLTWNFPTAGDEFDDATGTLTGGWTGGAGGSVAASGGAGTYAQGVGFRVRWGTGGIVGGRRVKGSTFLIPVLGSVYESNGTISNAIVTTLQTAANLLVTNGTTIIWHRPDPGGSNGSSHIVLDAQVPDKVSTLRSRRT